MKIEERIFEWCEGKVETPELLDAFEQALDTLDAHREALSRAENSLGRRELEHCQELRAYCWKLLDDLDSSLMEASELALAGHRSAFISAGDHIGRLAYQLNQALLELKNQALLVSGPTEIPSLNLLYRLHQQYQLDAPVVRTPFLRAVRQELALAEVALRELSLETVDSKSLETLQRTLQEHVNHLQSMARAVQEAEPDLTGYLLQANLTYTEINRLAPIVNLQLKDRGESSCPEINLLLTLIDDVRLGRAADHLLFESLDRFEKSLERLEPEKVASFLEGTELIYDFGETRDVSFLEEAQERFLEFASGLSDIQEGLNSRAIVERPLWTEQLCEVYRAIDDLLLSRISVDEYLKSLQRLGEHLRKNLGSSNWESLKRPLNVMLGGLDSLKQFTHDGREEHLRTGVLALNQGASDLRDALI